MGAARPSAGVAALNGSFVEFDGSGALGQEQSVKARINGHSTNEGTRPQNAGPLERQIRPGRIVEHGANNMAGHAYMLSDKPSIASFGWRHDTKPMAYIWGFFHHAVS